MDIKAYMDQYFSWLKSEFTFEKTGEYYEITAPYLDVNNDCLQVYVKEEKGTIYFTDDSATINTLESYGFRMTEKRREQMNSVLQQFGVVLDGRELVAEAPAHEFPQKKHMFIQAMLRVGDMYMVTQRRTSSLFTEDIQKYFDAHDIYCSENIQIKGMSGFSHNYDFLIQRSKTKPERFCTSLNNPTKSGAGNILFNWTDTKIVRKTDSELIVFLNDSHGNCENIIDAFQKYEAKTILWSKRDDPNSIDLLSA